jgi:hypothetical protein
MRYCVKLSLTSDSQAADPVSDGGDNVLIEGSQLVDRVLILDPRSAVLDALAPHPVMAHVLGCR